MILYEKVGRRYVPVRDTLAYDGLGNGSWLVHVEKGSTSIRRSVEPAHAALQFAAMMAVNKISKYLLQASEARPSNREYTKKQKELLKQMQTLPEKDRLMYWEYDSINGMAEKIIDLILENHE
jgi:hypothetical protein